MGHYLLDIVGSTVGGAIGGDIGKAIGGKGKRMAGQMDPRLLMMNMAGEFGWNGNSRS